LLPVPSPHTKLHAVADHRHMIGHNSSP
jgi:hypothetical protein